MSRISYRSSLSLLLIAWLLLIAFTISRSALAGRALARHGLAGAGQHGAATMPRLQQLSNTSDLHPAPEDHHASEVVSLNTTLHLFRLGRVRPLFFHVHKAGGSSVWCASGYRPCLPTEGVISKAFPPVLIFPLTHTHKYTAKLHFGHACACQAALTCAQQLHHGAGW